MERSRAKRVLEISEANYWQIFEASEDAIFVHELVASGDGFGVWNPEGQMVDLNPAFEGMRGDFRGEPLALDPRKLIHRESRPENVPQLFETITPLIESSRTSA